MDAVPRGYNPALELIHTYLYVHFIISHMGIDFTEVPCVLGAIRIQFVV